MARIGKARATGRMAMKSRLCAGAAALVLMSGAAAAQEFKFPIGEGAFNRDS